LETLERKANETKKKSFMLLKSGRANDLDLHFISIVPLYICRIRKFPKLKSKVKTYTTTTKA